MLLNSKMVENDGLIQRISELEEQVLNLKQLNPMLKEAEKKIMVLGDEINSLRQLTN